MINKISKVLQFPVIKFFVIISTFFIPIALYSAIENGLFSNEKIAFVLIILYAFYYFGLVFSFQMIFPNLTAIKNDSTNFICGVNLRDKKNAWLSKYTNYLTFYLLVFTLFSIFTVLAFQNSFGLYEKILLIVFLISLLIIISNLILVIIYIKKLIKDYSLIDDNWNKLNEKIMCLILNMTYKNRFEEFKIENVLDLSLETIRLNIIRRTLICIYTVGSYSDETKAKVCKYVYEHVIAYICDLKGETFEYILDFEKALGKNK